MTDGMRVTCDRCACEGDGAALLTWSAATTARGTAWTCGTCTRYVLWAVEAKLDEEWW